MVFEKGMELYDVPFLVKSTKSFDWGIIGQLAKRDSQDIAFKFARESASGDIEPGVVITVNGWVGEYNGAPQVTGSCRVLENPNMAVMSEVVPVSAVDAQESYKVIFEAVCNVRTPHLYGIARSLLEEHKDVLMTLPAGFAMHHACLGGWLEHTAGILRGALAISQVYPGKMNQDLLVVGAVLHDIGKVLEFHIGSTGLVSTYTFLGDGVGHASLGVGMIMSTAAKLGIDWPAPDVSALLNIVGSHAGNREWGACADPCTIEAMVISHLDNLDAKVNAFTNTLADKSCGESAFSKAAHQTIYKTLD